MTLLFEKEVGMLKNKLILFLSAIRLSNVPDAVQQAMQHATLQVWSCSFGITEFHNSLFGEGALITYFW